LGLFFLFTHLKHNLDWNVETPYLVIAYSTLIYMVGLIFMNFLRYEKINGTQTGELVLSVDHITIADTQYQLSQLKSINLKRSYDKRGDWLAKMYLFSPQLSNGLDNKIILELTDGTKISEKFQQTSDALIANAKRELVQYHKAGLLTWIDLLDALKITDYQEIQLLKKEIENYG
jgi:hypothetical protein